MSRKLCVPAVEAMVADGSLPEFDAEWIANLIPDNQLAAARKCARNFNVEPISVYQEVGKSRISHPSVSVYWGKR